MPRAERVDWTCCWTRSTPTIAGVWACTSWANDAVVKNSEPTKIGDGIGRPADRVGVGRTEPSTKQVEPTANRDTESLR